MRMQEMEDRGDESRWFAVATPKGSNQKWKKMGHKLTLFYYLHPTEGACVQQVSVIIFTSQPLSQLLGNFSWSLVMVTWRCYGYITPKCHSLRSTTELLPVSAALTEAVHVPVLLETLPITFCFVVFIIFLRAEPLKKGSESVRTQNSEGNYEKRGAVNFISRWQLKRWDRRTRAASLLQDVAQA